MGLKSSSLTLGGTGPNPGWPALAAATLEAANGNDISQQNVLRRYRKVSREVGPETPSSARLRAISLTLTMGDDQFTIDLLDHLLKF